MSAAAIALIGWSALSADPTGGIAVWLDELDLSGARQDFREPHARESVMGNVLAVAGRRYARGVGVHAKSVLTLVLRGAAVRFIAAVGVDDEKKTHPGSVEFQVSGDGKVLWSSGVMRGGDPAKPVDVDLAGVRTLELRAGDGGDGIDSDHADWLDARLVLTAPLDHLFPPDRRPDAIAKLSAEQAKLGFRLDEAGPGIWRLRVGRPEELTPLRFREERPRAEALAALPAGRLPFPVSAVGFKAQARGSTVELPLASGERIFGLGMNLKVFDPMGGKRTIRVSDDQTTVLGDSHAPVPFYVSTLGYGVYVDTARYASFYCGNLDPVREEASHPAAAANAGSKPGTSVAELYRPRALPAKAITVDVPGAPGVDVYIFAGPDMARAVARYNLFSGGGALPPLWALGPWYRASTELGQKEVLALLREFRERRIPCDVFGLEPGWQTHAYSCSFVWSAKYPDPGALLKEAADLGFDLNLWEHAFTHPTSPLHGPLLPWSGDYRVWGGLVPDFATAEGRKIFADYHRDKLVDRGVSGFKLDECDHQPLSATPWSFPECSRFPSGLDGEQMHLLIGPLYQRTILGAFRERNRRTFGLVRSSGALAAPLPFVLYSDAYDHRDYVRACATSGFAGVLWCPEVRDMGSLEELYRRLETCVFSALLQIDCWYLKNPVWKQIDKDRNNAGSFMDGWEKTEEVCRRLLELRASLIPYLYAAVAEYREAGTPPVRALVLDDPDDPATWAVDDEYLLGPSLLVAPLFTGQAKRKVYLPRGDWYDFWTGEKLAGGRTVEVTAPIDRIPVFVRGDTLLPLARPVERVGKDTVFDITVRIYGPRPRPFVLYEDDGISFDHEKGAQGRLELRAEGRAGTATRSGGYAGPNRYRIAGWDPVTVTDRKS